VSAEKLEAVAGSEIVVNGARSVEGETMIALGNWCSLPLAVYSLFGENY